MNRSYAVAPFRAWLLHRFETYTYARTANPQNDGGNFASFRRAVAPSLMRRFTRSAAPFCSGVSRMMLNTFARLRFSLRLEHFECLERFVFMA